MFTFINKNKIYIISSLVLLLFGIVYEFFAHGVYSVFMYGAFTIPLIFLAAGLILNSVVGRDIKDNIFYKLMCLTVVVASIMQGILVIYGIISSLINIYLFLAAVVGLMLIMDLRKSKEKKDY